MITWMRWQKNIRSTTGKATRVILPRSIEKEKLNELIGAIHEKDELLDSQEDFRIKENKKHVNVKNAYAQEVEKCEKLTSELSICHDTISNLRNENVKLIAKVEKLNVCDDSLDRKSTRLNSSHSGESRMPSSA